MLLLDNGSLEPASTLCLRRVAQGLSEKLGYTVHPVSLLHSSKVPPEQLEGTPASTLGGFMKSRLAEGCTRFGIIPLFFGPSGALTDYLPSRLATLSQEHPGLTVDVAPCLVQHREEADDRVARILRDQILAIANPESLTQERIILVDHGSPRREVTEVREAVGNQLRSLLNLKGDRLVTASMERREGPEYAFNEPLLETALRACSPDDSVIVTLLFLSPGRHAGPGGDIAQICERVRADHPGLRIRMTTPIATHPLLIEILKDRAEELSRLRTGPSCKAPR